MEICVNADGRFVADNVGYLAGTIGDEGEDVGVDVEA